MKHVNQELIYAEEYLRDTDATIFLTGKAGTGKTTFLQTLRKKSAKRFIVTAPTGVAAINAGGVTLHSFFQLPFGPFIPGSEYERPASHFRFSREKTNIIRNLDLLVIDEISMVRADLLDGVDASLRRIKRNSLPFGGVQLLMIGDLHQLPPVVKNEEWKLLSRFYGSPFFFSSKALTSLEMVVIELQQIYRQEDDDFIAILNQVRENRLTPASIKSLNSRVQDGFVAQEQEGYITLCTHNRSADRMNRLMLDSLPDRTRQYPAEVDGDFPEHTFPAAANLELKINAQVMFIRNDTSQERRYFNGKIGKVTHISDHSVRVHCPEDSEEIEVETVTWENIEYSLNHETLEISEDKIGSFRQYPLRHAWAITIHKSQGLTFDKAMIDAQEAFAHGQVYVALSRCRTLEGMVLTSPLLPQSLRTDGAVVAFLHRPDITTPSPEHFETAKIDYQQRLILNCFSFSRLRSLLQRIAVITEHTGVIHITGKEKLPELKKSADETVFMVSGNFQRQLSGLFRDDILPSVDPVIEERLAKASAYFLEKLSIIKEEIFSLEFDTDNKELRRKISRTQQLLEEETKVKLASVSSCKTGFSPTSYLRAISEAATVSHQPKKKVQPTYIEADIAHPELFHSLKEWRSRKANAENLAHFQVMHQKTLIQLAVNLPDNPNALLRIKGIGPKLAQRYGEELIEIIADYRKKAGVSEVTLPSPSPEKLNDKPMKQKTSPDTRHQTLTLLEKGSSLQEVAEQRSLTLQTIESHVTLLIEQGKIGIAALFEEQRLANLLPRVEKLQGRKLKEIFTAMDDDISYSEICFILAHLKHVRDDR